VRAYDRVLGRFISPDTIVLGAGNPQSLNRYLHVRNSPLSRINPTGHDDELANLAWCSLERWTVGHERTCMVFAHALSGFAHAIRNAPRALSGAATQDANKPQRHKPALGRTELVREFAAENKADHLMESPKWREVF